MSNLPKIVDPQEMQNYFGKIKQNIQSERERFSEELERVKETLKCRVSEIRKQMEEERKMDIEDLLGLPPLDIHLMSSSSSSQIDGEEGAYNYEEDTFVTQSEAIQSK